MTGLVFKVPPPVLSIMQPPPAPLRPLHPSSVQPRPPAAAPHPVVHRTARRPSRPAVRAAPQSELALGSSHSQSSDTADNSPEHGPLSEAAPAARQEQGTRLVKSVKGAGGPSSPALLFLCVSFCAARTLKNHRSVPGHSAAAGSAL